MAKKQLITNSNIEADLRRIVKHPAALTHEEYRKSLIPPLIIGAIMLVLMAVFEEYYKLILLISLILIAAYLVSDYFIKRRKISVVSVEDHEIKKENISYIKLEIYNTDRSSLVTRKLHEVRVYVAHFECGKSWKIPRENYTWSGEAPMSDSTIHELTHRGDAFWTVTDRTTGEIVMAYPAEYFEYESRP